MEFPEDFIYIQQDLPINCYKVFQDMRDKRELCDIILNVGNNSIYAHGVILAAGIPHFRSLLTSNKKAELNKAVLLENVSLLALEALIDFAYKCELKINMENVTTLLSAACFLQVDQVKKACIEFLVKVTSPESVFCFMQFGSSINCSELVNRLDDYVSENFEEITAVTDFLDLPYSYVRDLVSRDDLHVSSEEKVFEAIMNWIKFSPHQTDADIIPELLSCVRMSFLHPEYLQDNVAADEFLKKDLACMDIIANARDYHNFPERRDSETSWKFSTMSRRYKSGTPEFKSSFGPRKQEKEVPNSLARSRNEESETSCEGSNSESEAKKDLTKFNAHKNSESGSSEHSGENLQTNSEPQNINPSLNNERPRTKSLMKSLRDKTDGLRLVLRNILGVVEGKPDSLSPHSIDDRSSGSNSIMIYSVKLND